MTYNELTTTISKNGKVIVYHVSKIREDDGLHSYSLDTYICTDYRSADGKVTLYDNIGLYISEGPDNLSINANNLYTDISDALSAINISVHDDLTHNH